MSHAQGYLSRRLANVTVGSLLKGWLRRRSSEYYSVPCTTSTLLAARAMTEHNVGCLLVTPSDSLIQLRGIVTERDVLWRAAGVNADMEAEEVADIATTDVVSVLLQDSALQCVRIMLARGLRHLPVLADMASQRAVGVLSMRDLCRLCSLFLRDNNRPLDPLGTLDCLRARPALQHSVDMDVMAERALMQMQQLDTSCLLATYRTQGSSDVAGILTERDLLRSVARGGRRWEGLTSLRVGGVMTRHVVFAEASTPVEAALRVMLDHGFRHIPVRASFDALPEEMSIVSIRDLLRFLVGEYATPEVDL